MNQFREERTEKKWQKPCQFFSVKTNVCIFAICAGTMDKFVCHQMVYLGDGYDNKRIQKLFIFSVVRSKPDFHE